MGFSDIFTIGQPGPPRPLPGLDGLRFIEKYAWAWYEPRSLLGFAGGEKIPQWDDTSGNNRHILQPVVAEQPVLQAGGVAGYPSAAFDGTNQQSLTIGSAPAVEMTLFFVGRILTDGGTLNKETAMIFAGSNTGIPAFRYILRTGADLDEYGFNAVNFQNLNVSLNPFIAFAQAADANLLGRLSLAEFGSGTAGTGTGLAGTGLGLGGFGTVRTADTFPSWIATEVIIFSTLLADADSRRIARWLSLKYSVPPPQITT